MEIHFKIVLAHYIWNRRCVKESTASVIPYYYYIHEMNFLFFETLLLLPRAADCARRCPAETRAQVLARPVNALLFLSIFFSFCYSNNNNIICCCYIDSISSFILSADCCNSSSSSSRVYRGVAILLLAGRGHRNGE